MEAYWIVDVIDVFKKIADGNGEGEDTKQRSVGQEELQRKDSRSEQHQKENWYKTYQKQAIIRETYTAIKVGAVMVHLSFP
jgi:hypothetical protein